MFGFIVGTACLIGFISVYKRGKFRGFGWYRPWWLFRKLDTSPAQERVIRNAVETVKDGVRKFTRDGKSSRRELADVLREPDFDPGRVREWFAAREADLQQVRESLVDALGEVHEVLDDRQRDKLARLIERGLHWGRPFAHHGPYRSQPEETP